MKIDIVDYDYKLSSDRIALYPKSPRYSSRLLVLDRQKNYIEHRSFFEIDGYFREGDVLVLNNSKVFPARLIGNKKDTGGKVEIFLLRNLNGSKWEALVRPGKRLSPGTMVELADKKILAAIGERTRVGGRVVEFFPDGDLMELIWRYGEVPLPPYINRKAEEKDKETYQTVYAKNVGAVAAPTAGFHFTKELLDKIGALGVEIVYLTLHPGLGTFRPITVADVTKHKMEKELYSIPQQTAESVTKAKQQNRRIIAVGTTTVRALESSYDERTGCLKRADSIYTDKFIYPPYRFKVIDCLLTNFHLPKSTLLLLVSALAGREKIFSAYHEAIRERYRFYSYGDVMLIL
ncbi:MAG: tRNA preQ1(34) S-adenosylmethionine ribosyltransferase-isomerase QueA [Candidatus Zixiibacteriota bacterium]|nr:MAG: tRNA preQ1(34) S-adenosylmethionine ribosyltransferase-isomerase QueA [candidate division Zixibacteria bacterium]